MSYTYGHEDLSTDVTGTSAVDEGWGVDNNGHGTHVSGMFHYL